MYVGLLLAFFCPSRGWGGGSGSGRWKAEAEEEGPATATATRVLNWLPCLGPVLAVGWPLDDPGRPRNQPKNQKKQGGVPKWHVKWPKVCTNLAGIECTRYT
jgi:hypothetical protein